MSVAAEITHARVLKIALPIVLSNATVPLLGAVDTGVVGQLGAAAPIGAVAVGAQVLTAVYWFFGFLRMGTTGLAGQAAGAGDRPEVEAILARALIVGGAAGLAVILARGPLVAAALGIAPASAEVEGLAREYIAIRVWSAPAAIAVYGITGWLIALERTRGVLALQLIMNGTNVALDLWFVLGLGWGVPGVAVATFIAEWTGLLVGLALCRDGIGPKAWRMWRLIFDRARLLRMATVNTDIMIRSVLLLASFTSFTFVAAGMGDTTLAANQVLLQFLHITAFALDGFAFAAEALVSRAMGARLRGHLRRAALLTSLWGVGVSALMCAFFAVCGPWLIDLMAVDAAVRAEARVFLAYAAVSPLFGIAAFMLDGIFIGATRSRDMRNMMILSSLIYACAVAVLTPPLGNHGLWTAILVFFVARALTLWWRYPALEAEASAPRRT